MSRGLIKESLKICKNVSQHVGCKVPRTHIFGVSVPNTIEVMVYGTYNHNI